MQYYAFVEGQTLKFQRGNCYNNINIRSSSVCRLLRFFWSFGFSSDVKCQNSKLQFLKTNDQVNVNIYNRTWRCQHMIIKYYWYLFLIPLISAVNCLTGVWKKSQKSKQVQLTFDSEVNAIATTVKDSMKWSCRCISVKK